MCFILFPLHFSGLMRACPLYFMLMGNATVEICLKSHFDLGILFRQLKESLHKYTNNQLLSLHSLINLISVQLVGLLMQEFVAYFPENNKKCLDTSWSLNNHTAVYSIPPTQHRAKPHYQLPFDLKLTPHSYWKLGYVPWCETLTQ